MNHHSKLINMKFNKTHFLSLLLLWLASGLFAQDLKNLVPKDVFFVGTVDLNKIKSKEGFSELANLPVLLSLSDKIGRTIFNDTTSDKSSEFINLDSYGIEPSGKAYVYVSGNQKVMYGALVIALNNESDFTKRIKSILGTDPDSPIVEKNNVKWAQQRELKVVWNNKFAAIWGAFISPAYNDSVRKSLEAKYEAENVFPEDITQSVAEESVVEMATPEEEEVAAVVDDEVIDDGTVNVLEDEDTMVAAPAEDVYDDADTSEIVSEEGTGEIETNDYYDSYYGAKLVCDSILRDWCNNNLEFFLQDKGANSLTFNSEFNKIVKKNPDAAFIMDYGLFTGLYANAMGLSQLPSSYGAVMANIMSIYSGMKIYATINQNKDDVEVKMDVKYSEAMAKIYQDIKKKNISSKFLPYIDKNAMGYLAFAADIEGISKGVGNFLKESLPAIPQYGDYAVSAMDLIDIVVDEKRLYNILSGDAVVVFNGMKPMTVVRSTYDFDADFNKSEKTDTSTQVKPDVLIMVGVGCKEDVDKIFAILTKSQLLKQVGNYFTLVKNDVDFPVYFKIENDILFITNNAGYIPKPVIYPSNLRMGKEHSKLFKKNNAVLFADMSNIFKYLSQEGPSGYQKIFDEALKNFSNVTFSASMNKKNSSSSYIFKLKESKENSMVDILRFINFIYLDKVRYD